MHISDIIWLPQIIDKLDWKHHVNPWEVEEVLFDNPIYRKVEKGHTPGEDMYTAFGRSHAGRYLTVFFIYKLSHEALIISARDMSKTERQQYERKR
jgi:uncharacterized DUF497 family protein